LSHYRRAEPHTQGLALKHKPVTVSRRQTRNALPAEGSSDKRSKYRMKLRIGPAALIGALLSASTTISLAQSDLPDFGDTGVVPIGQEYYIGRAWLMSFRSQVRVVEDPLIQDYVETLVYRLAETSELKDRRLEIVVVDNPTINAFAVPGGVIGVHAGLLLKAESEAQCASVLTHELAHLSQRHFSRGVEARQNARIPSLGGLLTGMVLVAAGAGDAGMATIAGTQAATQQNQLRYSRQHEQEADRIGIKNLANAGMDPNASAQMFTLMQRASPSARPPEFLLTHPLTETRISDARNRAREYPRGMYEDNPDYQLIRARVALRFRENDKEAVRYFRDALERGGRNVTADQYGLALALTRSGATAEARKYLAPLRKGAPASIAYGIAEAELLLAEKRYDDAFVMLSRGMNLIPGNHPITMTMAKARFLAGDYADSARILWEHAQRRPRDPSVWYELAEAAGKAGNTLAVHWARAQYFVLTGALQQAEQQLGYAAPLAGNEVNAQRIDARITYVRSMRKALGQLK